jgi:hypothetical protein
MKLKQGVQLKKGVTMKNKPFVPTGKNVRRFASKKTKRA